MTSYLNMLSSYRPPLNVQSGPKIRRPLPQPIAFWPSYHPNEKTNRNDSEGKEGISCKKAAK